MHASEKSEMSFAQYVPWWMSVQKRRKEEKKKRSDPDNHHVGYGWQAACTLKEARVQHTNMPMTGDMEQGSREGELAWFFGLLGCLVAWLLGSSAVLACTAFFLFL